MKKLYEILGQVPSEGDVGIEIEVEGRDLANVNDAFWRSEQDGSLRGESLEYVLKKPIPADKAPAALRHLRKKLDDYGSKLNFSFRTSVHVHVNCQQLTHAEYAAFIYTYMLLEEPLMNFCGKERKGNRFCLRLQDAEGMLEYIGRVFRDERGLLDIPRDYIRYSALNLEATVKYGSIEFRAMRGNLDVDVLSVWVKTLMRIREYAKQQGNPINIYDQFSKLGARGLMQEILGDLMEHYDYPKVVQDIHRSFSLSIDLPYAYRPAVEPKAPKKAKENVLPTHLEWYKVTQERWDELSIAHQRVLMRDYDMAMQKKREEMALKAAHPFIAAPAQW